MGNRKKAKQKNGYIYRIKNLSTGKVYVGSTNDPEKRWPYHQYRLKKGNHHSILLQRAWNKYGPDDFGFDVIESVVPYQKETVIEREQFWMDALDCYNPKYGYNISPTAWRVTIDFTDELRKKLSRAHKGRWVGSKSTSSKLTEQQVAVIKERLVQGENLKDIADDFGVCFQSISLIKHGKTWRHVSGPELSKDEWRELWHSKSLGERNPAAVLGVNDVQMIRMRLAAGEIAPSIARDYGVVNQTIYNIKHRITWSHLEAPKNPLQLSLPPKPSKD